MWEEVLGREGEKERQDWGGGPACERRDKNE